MSEQFDKVKLQKTFTAVKKEFNLGEETIQFVMVKLPKPWQEIKDSRKLSIANNVPREYSTENTIEIEVLYEDPLTNTRINYKALDMQAPW